MKALKFLFVFIFCLGITSVDAQINLKDKLKRQTNNRANKNVDQGINKGLDNVENGVKGLFKKKKTDADTTKTQGSATGAKTSADAKPSLAAYSKFDFVPGEKVIFYDDFTAENIGDFPVQWNTTGSGEVVTTNLYEGRWFKITNGRGATVLDIPLVLPENYTIEFDVVKQQDPKNNNISDFSFEILSTLQT